MVHTAALPQARARVARFEATRDRLIRAARDTVARDGWQGAQIALIAARARVATGSVYRHFSSKADLFAQVLARVSQREVDVVAGVAGATGPAAGCLREAVHVFVTRALAGRRLAYALIAEPCEPEIDRERLVHREALARVIERLVTRGIATGEFAAIDARLAASCVTGAFMEALVGPLAPDVKPDTRTAAAFAATVSDLCVRLVAKGPGRARKAARR